MIYFLAYKQVTDWGTLRQILSLITTILIKNIARYIPELIKYKYSMGRKYSRTTTHSYQRQKRINLRPANKSLLGLHYDFCSFLGAHAHAK